MNENQSPPRPEFVTWLAGAVTLVSIAIVQLVSSSKIVTAFAAGGGFVVVATMVYYIVFMGRRYPTSLSISLVGPPGVGKTVYLTILFRELETGRLGPLLFAPAGLSTTEEVAKNVALMASGKFPGGTPLGAPRIYEAVARLGRILPRQYRIRISDFAGEYLLRKPNDEKWFHGSEFFDHLVASDAIMFMIDCETLLDNSSTDRVAYLENSLIATLNIVIEMRNTDPMKPLRVPVALLFSKADVVWGAETNYEREVVAQLANFIAICSRRCRNFSYFFVSSLGQAPTDGNVPPRRISPRGIVEPLKWILRA